MDDTAFLVNACASFDDIAKNGTPALPLAFDQVRMGQAERVNAAIYSPSTNEILQASNIIYERHEDNRPPDRAYWVRRKLQNCLFGAIKLCTVLKFRHDPPDPDVPWEVTEERAYVKIMSWQRMREIPHAEDGQKEIAAMQHISKNGTHPHVMAPLDVLADEDYLLAFMPYCGSCIELFSFVETSGSLPEPMARYYFRQIIDGLSHLQRMGVCHRGISLERMLVDEESRLQIIALDMCLRVPFAANDGSVADASAGTLRLLLQPLSPCGMMFYTAPEILSSTEPFDGFAVDLWSAGVILFIMLTGLPPWESPRDEDARYRMINRGHLEKMLNAWGKPISPPAADLLQRMFAEDPRQRLTLIEIKEHPWFLGETEDVAHKDGSMEGWRL